MSSLDESTTTAIAEKPKPAFVQPIAPPDAHGELLATGHSATKLDLGMFQAVQTIGPRDLEQFEKNVLWEAKRLGDRAYYQWEQGGKPIVGGSVGLAMLMIRQFGKCTVIPEVVAEDSLRVTFKATFVDFETGAFIARLFRQRKSAEIGEKFKRNADQAARAEDIVFQIGQSKAIRNVGLAAMPAWLVDEAIKAAQDTELQTIEKMGLVKARDALLVVFAKNGISTERVEAQRGKAASEFTARDLIELKGALSAIRDGQADPRGLFPEPGDPKPVTDEPAHETPDAKAEKTAEDLFAKKGAKAATSESANEGGK